MQRKRICADWAHFNCHFGDGCRFGHDGPGGASQRGTARGSNGRWLGIAEASGKAIQRETEHGGVGGKGVSGTAGEARANIYDALSSMGVALRLPKSLKPCPHWTLFRCNFGDSCGFSHDGPGGPGQRVDAASGSKPPENDAYDSNKLMESAQAQMQAAIMLQQQAEARVPGDAAMDPTAAIYQQFMMSQGQMAAGNQPQLAAPPPVSQPGSGSGMGDLMSMFAFDSGAPPAPAAHQDPAAAPGLGLDDLTSMFSFSASGEPDKEPPKTQDPPPQLGMMPGFVPGGMPGGMPPGMPGGMPVPGPCFPMHDFGAQYGSQGFPDMSKGCGKGCWQPAQGGKGWQDFSQPHPGDESWRQSGLQLNFAIQQPGLSLAIPSLGMETTIGSGGPSASSFSTVPQGMGGMPGPDGSWGGQKRAAESWSDGGAWNGNWQGQDWKNDGTSPPPLKQPSHNNWADQYNNPSKPGADGDPDGRKYCYHWQTNSCSRGDSCRFSHMCPGGPAPNAWKKGEQDEQSLAPSLMQMAETSLRQDALQRSGPAPSSMSDLPDFLR